MKKSILSVIVIASFIGYAIFVQKKGTAQTPIMTPVAFGKSKVSFAPTVTTSPPTPTPTSPAQSLPTTAESQPTATPQPVIPTATPKPSSPYKDGSYTGSAADAFYGNIQVKVTVSAGKITDVQFLQYPNDQGTSIAINQQADPMLAQEAIQTQSANVDIVSGATESSQAFIQSMQSALDQAKS